MAAFKETVGGQLNPLEAVETVMHLTDYEYGGGIRVVLPPEVTLPQVREESTPERPFRVPAG